MNFQIAVVYTDQRGGRKLRVFNDEEMRLIDPELIASSIIRSSLWTPNEDVHASLTQGLFDLFGKISTAEDVTSSDFSANLYLISLYIHSAMRKFLVSSSDFHLGLSNIPLKLVILTLYPGIYSCKRLISGEEMCSAQVRASFESVSRAHGDFYMIEFGSEIAFLIPSPSDEISGMIKGFETGLEVIHIDALPPELRNLTLKLKPELRICRLFQPIHSHDVRVQALFPEDAVMSQPSYHTFLEQVLTTLSRTVFS